MTEAGILRTRAWPTGGTEHRETDTLSGIHLSGTQFERHDPQIIGTKPRKQCHSLDEVRWVLLLKVQYRVL